MATPITRFAFSTPIAVLGDLHGRSDLLDAILPRLGTRPLVVIGDVIDRGPDARGTIDRLLARKAVGVRGNHEEWILAWMRGEGLDEWAILPKMGGLATLRSYGAVGDNYAALVGQAHRIPTTHRAWLEALSPVGDLEVMGDSYWLIHAGVPSHVSLKGIAYDQLVPFLARHHLRDLHWGDNDPEAAPPLDRPVIMGHRPREEPLDTGDVIAIDTGAGTVRGGGRLTALLLPERSFVTVGL